MKKFINSWGLYPWFIEDGEYLIFPKDIESFKKLSPYGKVFRCIDEVDGYLVLKYGNETFRVKSDLYKIVDAPFFEIGCNVKLVKDNTQVGTIEEIQWHQKNKVPMYYISINGKQKSTRYFNEDLIAT
ncbi:hypothetical protein DFR58_10431 [Anaerobacterium chartisolvens]|uniref:Uncharacterized protein n=1 Tax=Anaerobacterium chartisolvens TaxID=1297424 RepID=A0A369BB62_9FIRM|nr:hypothetical protein [Anaerobacterium chartisolvens]RCX18762.1 hypothetical protein DFR58_10431 [Anaerobacterium chartisolvens]